MLSWDTHTYNYCISDTNNLLGYFHDITVLSSWIPVADFDRMNKPSHLLIFVPGQGLCSQDKPVLLRPSLHDADVDS